MHLKFTSFKKLILLFLFAEVFSFSSFANPGDTTWVTVYNLRKLTHYGNYDTTAVYPTGKRYRKIRLHYILGRYACAPTDQYCGQWDYTTQIYSRPAGKDTVEIARIITPYAGDWLQQNKSHDYVVDITDYASVLDGTNDLRFIYSGYSWGFTITLKIEFIEGIPPMDALSVKNIYDGYYIIGHQPTIMTGTPATSQPNPAYIENKLVPKALSFTAPVAKVFIKNTVSGHGADASNCGEFCKKYYNLKINNAQVSQKLLWRSDCGINHVYPQTGTWIYERANWCPGAVVWPIYHDLSALTSANTTFTADIDMQPYTTGNPTGGFNWVSQLMNYSAPNHTLDVAVEDVLAPTKDPNYFRNNSTCSNPLIKIRNVGTNTVTTVVFNYGLKGQTPATYTWSGTLKFLDTALVALPSLTSIVNNTVNNIVFQVSTGDVNGTSDQYALNNTYTALAVPVPTVPADFIVKFSTNNSSGSSGANETTWTLFDDAGNVMASQSNCSNATTYKDTVFSLPPGCYKFSIDDEGCDGTSWWANPNAGTGDVRLMKLNGTSTILSFPGDIGCNYTKYFKVLAPPQPTVDVDTQVGAETEENRIDIYPNPANNTAYIKFDLNKSQSVNYEVIDISGKKVYEKNIAKIDFAYEKLPLTGLNSGIYFVNLRLQDGSVITKKMVVQNN